ncbi:hypothetical protein MMAN_06700 [Mycobacterium mantenii]|uniref:Uncharacterized protein n=1 Tax=Mycobacterium mantenii TaxID=560555 RepID=A0ABM7JM06_MYCNT|nr:hypothetical protein [Mycobacterium mantenii]BBY36536.1 hypothetical protein MMAN_06700 [Mycobacterium mantenii]
MDVAGLSPERGARSSATHRSATTRDRRGRRSPTGSVRAEATRQGPSRPAPAVECAAGAAAPDTADQLQADYFVRLLTGRRGLIDLRIGECQRKIATAEVKGDVDAVVNLRRQLRIAEQDRQTLDALIDKLCRRFVHPAPGAAPAASPQAHPVGRRAARAPR